MAKSENRVLEGAFRLFLNSSYDGVSTSDIEREIGLTRGAIYYTYKSKLELFRAVIDHFILNKQDVFQKTGLNVEVAKIISLKEFFEIYINGARRTIESMRTFVRGGNNGFAGYFSLLYQAHNLYEGFDEMIYERFFNEYRFIKAVVQNAIEKKEIRSLDADEVSHQIRYIFIGCSFEKSFHHGLVPDEIKRHLEYYYEIIKL